MIDQESSAPITCEHCGSVIGREAPLESAGLVFYPRERRAIWHGSEVRLPRAQSMILEALVAAQGGLISAPVLMERTGYEGLDHAGNLRIHLWQLRKSLPGLPIHNEYGLGYAWRPATQGQKP